MKTKFIILGLLVAFAVPAFAQRDTIRSNKNEFSFGYWRNEPHTHVSPQNQLAQHQVCKPLQQSRARHHGMGLQPQGIPTRLVSNQHAVQQIHR